MPEFESDQSERGATKATARLPGLNIEIVHRQSPSGDAEQISIHLQAMPSFEAFGIDGDEVVMTNRAGVPVVMYGRKFRERLNPGQNARAIAQRLTRTIWQARGGGDFAPAANASIGDLLMKPRHFCEGPPRLLTKVLRIIENPNLGIA